MIARTQHTENQECGNALETTIEENAKDPLFKQFPLEVRLMICEFATVMKKEITVGGPYVRKCTNKKEADCQETSIGFPLQVSTCISLS